jgi:1,4-dihydroxy-2-naphthoyl-CoA hydrolase
LHGRNEVLRSLSTMSDTPDGATRADQPPRRPLHAVAGRQQRATGGPAALDGVTRFMGMHWDDPDTVRLSIRPELINAGGLLSGVVTYALVDYGMGGALWVHTTEDEHIATINIALNYIETATEGEVVCRTSLDRRNRTTAVLRSEVFHEDGRLLVTAVGSYAIFPARRGVGTDPPAQ